MTRLFLLLFAATAAFAETADLRMVSWQDQSRRIMFTAYNFGPGIARDVVMTVEIPPDIDVAFYDSTRCDTTARPIRCTASALAISGDSLPLDFQVHLPNRDATYVISATVTSGGSTDPDPSNNAASIVYETAQVTHFFASITPPVARVEPGESYVFQAGVSNFTDSEPADVRVHFEATNGTIEKLEPEDPRWSCTTAGASADCTAAALEPNCRCSKPIAVTLRSRADLPGTSATLSVNTTGSLPDEFPTTSTATLETYRNLLVTNTADAGAGSLRQAMLDANALCTPGPCRIKFAIPAPVPPEGWFTIIPATELPRLTARRVIVDGLTQTALTGDTNPAGPEIAIDGHLALRGLEIHSSCDAMVQGLAIGNFIGGDGLWVSSNEPCPEGSGPDRRVVARNHIGVDPSGSVAWPNNRGLNLNGAVGVLVTGNDISRNVRSGVWMWDGLSATLGDNIIDRNGKSGIFLGPEVMSAEVTGNTITGHPDMGVAIARGAGLIEVRRNSIRDNLGLGIDWGLDGVSPADDDDAQSETNAPVLFSARWNGASGTTQVTLSLRSKPLATFASTWVIDFYTNDGPNGDGEQWAGSSYAQVAGDGVVTTLEVPANLRGKWLNATATRVHYLFSRPPGGGTSANAFGGGETQTSEMSNLVLVR